MELDPSEEQSIALDAFRRFLETEIAPVVAPRRDAIHGLWKVVEVVIDDTLALNNRRIATSSASRSAATADVRWTPG
jgi:hypothetical protein